jgi:hypothetical protein
MSKTANDNPFNDAGYNDFKPMIATLLTVARNDEKRVYKEV